MADMVNFPYQPPDAVQRDVRSWAKLDKEKFRAAIINSDLYSEACKLTRIFLPLSQHPEVSRGQFAPVKRVTIRQQRLAVWVDTECIELRRRSRMLERHFRRSNLPSDKLTSSSNLPQQRSVLLEPTIYRAIQATEETMRWLHCWVLIPVKINVRTNQRSKIFTVSSIRHQYGKPLKVCLQSPICHHRQHSLTVSNHTRLMK